MTDPLRFHCSTEADIPHPETLMERVERGRHAVLQLSITPTESPIVPELERLARTIATRLPEDFKVFYSDPGPAGTHNITVMRLISRPEIIRNEEALVGAARLFRQIATERMHTLAAHLRVPVSQLWTEYGPWRPRETPDAGRLPEGWKFCFHGFQCRFDHSGTGQSIDVELGFEEEFGVLDPHFLARFAASTPGLEAVSRLFIDGFHDPERALAVLLERGRLRRVLRSGSPGTQACGIAAFEASVP